MADNEPTGVDLCSGTTDGDTLGDINSWDWTEREISLGSGTSIESGQKYAIVVRTLSGDGTNWTAWNTDGGAQTYANGGGSDSIDSGASWTYYPAYDKWFKTKAGGVEKDTHTTITGNSYSQTQGVLWTAMTFTATSSYTIDAVVLKMCRANSPGTVTVSIRRVTGETYLPEKPTNPTPADEASDVTLDGTGVTWEDGGGATSYNVYHGTLSGFLSLLESGVTDTSYTLRSTNWPLYGDVQYWRVDAVNDAGTTTGDEWYFTNLIFYPPTPSGVTWSDPGNATGYTGTPTGVNNMLAVRRLVGAANNVIWYEV